MDEEQQRLAALDAYFAQHTGPELEAHSQRSPVKHDASSALAAVSGIDDPELLRDLLAAGIRPETFACLALLPLCEVAWADGDISSRERDAILKAAVQHGIESGTAARALLEVWLATRPELKMVDAWKEYIAALAVRLPPDRAKHLAEEILGRARDIAATSGGILGLGAKVSVSEQFVLDELEHAFRP
ncbi:hypothetical protein [Anatilimnocola floriformis]|uniref:hypothetical protein n=1 Tax=Anatilimnocola floriformis TaxID=2948575 RepID=UPI0020C25D19|nr:hypothetical protein [Anatilimnocola floriformis]